jgi:hypothetical protein
MTTPATDLQLLKINGFVIKLPIIPALLDTKSTKASPLKNKTKDPIILGVAILFLISRSSSFK